MPEATAFDAGPGGEKPVQDQLVSIAQYVLKFFAETADAAREALQTLEAPSLSAMASINSLTDQVVRTLSSMATERQRSLAHLCREPAVARIVARDESNTERVYFICRATPLTSSFGDALVVSYRAPLGRLAALPVGTEDEIRTPRGSRYFGIVETASLRPQLSDGDWDSVNSILHGQDYGPLTVVSLRKLLPMAPGEARVDLLEALLAEDRAERNVQKGIQKDVIAKMGLRDQPLLDQYQDEIFRLPIGTRLALMGPPGSGKTTTLIKRLGLKLDSEYLEPDEKRLVNGTLAGEAAHASSWIMFTPTELLKLYVKEAFAREGIAASELHIHTWSDYRRDIARKELRLLRTAAGGGPFVLKEHLSVLLPAALENQSQWFDDFFHWQTTHYWGELANHAQRLSNNGDSAVASLGKRLSSLVARASTQPSVEVLLALTDVSKPVEALVARLTAETDIKIRKSLSDHLTRDAGLLDKLLEFLKNLDESADEPDDIDGEDEDESDNEPSRLDREGAFDAYSRATRAQARAIIANRALPPQSRNRKVLDWLGDRSLDANELHSLGVILRVQTSARRFVNPIRRYLRGLSARYRRFRRESQSNMRWYRAEPIAANDLSPLELDAVILATLRSANAFLGDSRVAREIDLPRYGILKAIRELYRTQVMVDEATDFSPLQLACMGALSDPAAKSFFACGDFNQRITSWGSRSTDDLKWVFQDIVVRSINITYRHSQQLNDLARQLVLTSNPNAPEAQLPRHAKNVGFAPVIGRNLADTTAAARWVAARIAEIERLTPPLPSVAVLVNSEEQVQSIASAIDYFLVDQNLRAVACPDGRVVGQENDVRVFDVRHIKGLEFEAVFFLRIDELAELQPDLFDKYLYVGATRAATYLGVTTAGTSLPSKIAALKGAFRERWG